MDTMTPDMIGCTACGYVAEFPVIAQAVRERGVHLLDRLPCPQCGVISVGGVRTLHLMTPDALAAASAGVRTYNDAQNLARHLKGLDNAGLAQLAAALQAEASARGLLGAIAPLGAAVSALEDTR